MLVSFGNFRVDARHLDDRCDAGTIGVLAIEIDRATEFVKFTSGGTEKMPQLKGECVGSNLYVSPRTGEAMTTRQETEIRRSFISGKLFCRTPILASKLERGNEVTCRKGSTKPLPDLIWRCARPRCAPVQSRNAK